MQSGSSASRKFIPKAVTVLTLSSASSAWGVGLPSSLGGPILVFGKIGQVGSALVRLLGSRAIPPSVEEVDFEKPRAVSSWLERYPARPVAVINAAAYTQVDQAEKEESRAFSINAESPALIASYCAKRDIPFVHYSTDYVYPGDGVEPWTEQSKTGPLSAYGRSKLAGDEAIAAAHGKFLNFRTSWVYDSMGQNFVNTMLKLGAERENLRVVSDQIGAPTYALHLAHATLRTLEAALLQARFPSGVYHACNSGETSWHGFAEEIFAQARKLGFPLKVKEVKSIPSSEYPTPARRPENSRLNCAEMRKVFGIELPNWKIGLKECLEAKGHSSQ